MDWEYRTETSTELIPTVKEIEQAVKKCNELLSYNEKCSSFAEVIYKDILTAIINEKQD